MDNKPMGCAETGTSSTQNPDINTDINSNQAESYDWDDVINDASDQNMILPEGDYNFSVIKFERGRFPGSAKLPPGNKAILTLKVLGPDGPVTTKEDLILNKKLEFKLAGFFRSIGQKKRGEEMRMDWSKVEGAKGYAHFRPRTYTDFNGNQHTYNSVEKYLDPIEADTVNDNKISAGPDRSY